MNKDIIFKFKELEIPTLKIPVNVADFDGQEKPMSPEFQEMVLQTSPRKKKKKAGIVSHDLLNTWPDIQP